MDELERRDRPTIPIVGELKDNDEPKLTPEEREAERVRARKVFEAERKREER